MISPIDNALTKARALLARVNFDSDGIMVGHVRQGGNGGLLSSDSIKAADQLRLAFDRIDQEPADNTAELRRQNRDLQRRVKSQRIELNRMKAALDRAKQEREL